MGATRAIISEQSVVGHEDSRIRHCSASFFSHGSEKKTAFMEGEVGFEPMTGSFLGVVNSGKGLPDIWAGMWLLPICAWAAEKPAQLSFCPLPTLLAHPPCHSQCGLMMKERAE